MYALKSEKKFVISTYFGFLSVLCDYTKKRGRQIRITMRKLGASMIFAWSEYNMLYLEIILFEILLFRMNVFISLYASGKFNIFNIKDLYQHSLMLRYLCL